MKRHNRIKIKCLLCDKIFEEFYCTVKTGRRFCSTKCFYKWHCKENNKRWTSIKKNCNFCNKEYFVQKCREHLSKYCSTKCLFKSRQKRKKVKCIYCNKNIEVVLSKLKKYKKYFCNDKCYRKHNVGKNTTLWRGGITRTKRPRATTEYKKWRKAVFEKSNFTCQICNKISNGDIFAHHIKNWKPYPKLRFDVNNGMTVCLKCHKIVNKEMPLFSIKQ